MNLAVVLGLVTFFGWGSGDLFTIIATRRIGANLATFWIFFFSFCLSLVILPMAPHDISGITIPLLGLNIFLGILCVSGNVLISHAFRLSSAPLVGIIIQAFPALVLLLSALIFHDAITTKQFLFLGIILCGVIVCSLDFRKLLEAKKIFDKGTLLAVIAMIFLSIYFTFSRVLIRSYGWFLPNFISTACFPIIYLLIRKKPEKFQVPKPALVLFAVFMAGLLLRAGDFALNAGLALANASSIVAPIASASPILFVIMAFFIFKDKLTKQQLFGIVTTLIGIVLLTYFGQTAN